MTVISTIGWIYHWYPAGKPSNWTRKTAVIGTSFKLQKSIPSFCLKIGKTVKIKPFLEAEIFLHNFSRSFRRSSIRDSFFYKFDLIFTPKLTPTSALEVKIMRLTTWHHFDLQKCPRAEPQRSKFKFHWSALKFWEVI